MNIVHVRHGLKNVPTLHMCLVGPNLCYQYYTFFILVVLIYLNIDFPIGLFYNCVCMWNSETSYLELILNFFNTY